MTKTTAPKKAPAKTTAKPVPVKKPAAKKAPAAPPLSAILGKTPSRIGALAITTATGFRDALLVMQARRRSKTLTLQFRAALTLTAKSGEQTVFAGVWAVDENEAVRSLIADLEQSNLARVASAVETDLSVGAGLKGLPAFARIVPYSPEPAAPIAA